MRAGEVMLFRQGPRDAEEVGPVLRVVSDMPETFDELYARYERVNANTKAVLLSSMDARCMLVSDPRLELLFQQARLAEQGPDFADWVVAEGVAVPVTFYEGVIESDRFNRAWLPEEDGFGGEPSVIEATCPACGVTGPTKVYAAPWCFVDDGKRLHVCQACQWGRVEGRS